MKKVIVFLFSIGLFLVAGMTNAEAKDFNVRSMSEFQKSVQSNLTTFENEFTITYNGDINSFKNRIGSVISNILADKPELKGYLSKSTYSYVTKGNQAVVKYKVNYTLTKNEYNYVVKEAKALATTIKKTNKTQYKQVKAVNDYVVKNTTYKSTGRTADHSPYGVFKNKQAVCQGYALAAFEVFKQLGISAQYVTGRAGNENHAWLKVKVDGSWYNLDVTWNDPKPNKPNQSTYNYFLLSDKVLAKDHSWDNSKFGKATSTKYDFYQNATYATQINNDVYYSNKAQGGKLYKYSLTTKKNVKLSNARPLFIQSYNNKLYYSDYANGGYLTQSNLNGKSTKVLSKNHAKHLYVKSNTLYFDINGAYKNTKVN